MKIIHENQPKQLVPDKMLEDFKVGYEKNACTKLLKPYQASNNIFCDTPVIKFYIFKLLL